MSQHQKYEAGEGEEWRDFYTQHRGGAGNVIMVTVFPPNSDFHGASVGLFSCIETAEKWAATFPDDHPTVFAPYVVDEPDYGNAAKQ